MNSDQAKPAEPEHERSLGIIRTMVVALLLGWVPLLIAGFLAHRVLDGQEELLRVGQSEQMSRELNRISRLLDPEVHLQMLFQRWAERIEQASAPIDLGKVGKRLEQTVGAEVTVVAFDSGGNIDQKREDSIPNRYVLERLIWVLTRSTDEAIALMRTNRKRLNQVFGPDSPFLTWRENEGKAILYIQRGQRGMLYWKRAPGAKRGGLLMIIWRIPDFMPVFERTMKKRLGPGRSLFLWGRGEPPRLIAGVSRPALDHALLGLAGAQGTIWFDEKTGWTSTTAGEARLLYARNVPRTWPEAWKARINPILLLLLLFATWVGVRLFRPGSEVFVSIRWKLTFLFVLALYLPVAGVAFLGFRTLQDRREVLGTEISRLAREAISRLDGKFAGDNLEFTRLCRSLRDHPDMRRDPKLMSRVIKPLVEQQKVLHWEVRSIQGEMMCSHGAPGTMEGLETFFEGVGKAGIQKHLDGRMRAMGQKMLRPPDPVVEKALTSPVLGFSNIVEIPDVAHSSHVGNVLLYWYWDAYQDKDHPAGLVSIFQALPHAFRQFLQVNLPDPAAAREGFTLVARDKRSGRVFPADIAPNGELQALLDRVQVSQEVIRATVPWRDGRWLVTGAPGKNLQDYALLALFPEDRVEESVAGLRRAIAGALALILLFAGVTGFILSRTFLQPIGEIDRGLQALGRRETGYRVAWSRADELGRLAQSFNVMLEDLKEMELAKIVQETLTPSSFPESARYEGRVSMTTASRLGGDYADIQTMPDGRILVAIGDVTGHGVGAALLMTMVKAGVFRYSEKPTTLSELGVELNSMVFHHFHRRMLMTFFVGLLTPESGKFEYMCAGHPYPFIVDRNNAIRQLELIQMPLGTSLRRSRFDTQVETLGPGEKLVLYTDGCYEVTDGSGKMLGWKPFCKIMVEALEQGLAGAMDGFWTAFRRHRPDAQLEDDCTIILVRRKDGPV